MAKSTRPNQGMKYLLLVIGITIFGGLFFGMQKNQYDVSRIAYILASPQDKLTFSINKHSAAGSAVGDFKIKVKSEISSTKTGLTQAFNAQMDGTAKGQIGEGEKGSVDVRISNSLVPDRSINLSVITMENGDIYMKSPTEEKWMKYTKEDLKKQAEKNVSDASLYGLDILSSLFEKNQALLSSIKKDTVKYTNKETASIEEKDIYEAEVDMTAYINALSQDEDNTEKEMKEVKEILANTTMTIKISVDRVSGYVAHIEVTAKKLKQLVTPEIQELGLSSTHDMDLTIDLSKFGEPIEVNPPAPDQVIQGKVEGIWTEINNLQDKLKK